jgi:hypothetical protein
MRHPLKWLAAIGLCAGMAIPASPAQAKVPSPNGRLGGVGWRRAMLALAVALAVAFATPAYAAVVDHGSFTSEDYFGPMVITDLPCLEGKEFIATGAELIRGNFVDAGDAGFPLLPDREVRGDIGAGGRSRANLHRKRLGRR